MKFGSAIVKNLRSIRPKPHNHTGRYPQFPGNLVQPQETSKDNALTISAVPTLAPSMTARAGINSMAPRAANEVTIITVAMLL